MKALRASDRLLTVDGRAVPVKCGGRQTVHRPFTPELRFRPIRVRAGVLGENVQHSDLVVTSDHGLLIDGLIVQAVAMVSGLSIERVLMVELADRVTFPYETEGYEAILAASAPAETFVDDITRCRLDHCGDYEALYGNGSLVAELDLPRVKSARQLPARSATGRKNAPLGWATGSFGSLDLRIGEGRGVRGRREAGLGFSCPVPGERSASNLRARKASFMKVWLFRRFEE